MKLYIECFYADGRQILGNMDGQAVIEARRYSRTNAYKMIRRIVKNPNHMNGKVDFAKIVDENGDVLETIMYPLPIKPIQIHCYLIRAKLTLKRHRVEACSGKFGGDDEQTVEYTEEKELIFPLSSKDMTPTEAVKQRLVKLGYYSFTFSYEVLKELSYYEFALESL